MAILAIKAFPSHQLISIFIVALVSNDQLIIGSIVCN